MTVTDEMVATFKAAWEKADAEGKPERSRAGLEAVSEAMQSELMAVRAIHEPIDSVMYPSQTIVKVCTGCGTDDGNWQRWPCPTVRALGPVSAND